MKFIWQTLAALLLLAPPVSAQTVGRAVLETMADPTTYVAPAAFYVAARGDWNSSQVFFAHGDGENNPLYTVAREAGEPAIPYGAGNALIAHQALYWAGVEAANNLAAHLLVNALSKRNPSRKATITKFGRVERIAVSVALTSILSGQHFAQWHTNVAAAHARGW